MIYDFRRRARPFREERIEVFTDGNDDYTYVLKSFFPWSISIMDSLSRSGTPMENSYARRGALSMETRMKMT